VIRLASPGLYPFRRSVAVVGRVIRLDEVAHRRQPARDLVLQLDGRILVGLALRAAFALVVHHHLPLDRLTHPGVGGPAAGAVPNEVVALGARAEVARPLGEGPRGGEVHVRCGRRRRWRGRLDLAALPRRQSLVGPLVAPVGEGTAAGSCGSGAEAAAPDLSEALPARHHVALADGHGAASQVGVVGDLAVLVLDDHVVAEAPAPCAVGRGAAVELTVVGAGDPSGRGGDDIPALVLRREAPDDGDVRPPVTAVGVVAAVPVPVAAEVVVGGDDDVAVHRLTEVDGCRGGREEQRQESGESADHRGSSKSDVGSAAPVSGSSHHHPSPAWK
jgi:hypothetical protein